MLKPCITCEDKPAAAHLVRNPSHRITRPASPTQMRGPQIWTRTPKHASCGLWAQVQATSPSCLKFISPPKSVHFWFCRDDSIPKSVNCTHSATKNPDMRQQFAMVNRRNPSLATCGTIDVEPPPCNRFKDLSSFATASFMRVYEP